MNKLKQMNSSSQTKSVDYMKNQNMRQHSIGIGSTGVSQLYINSINSAQLEDKYAKQDNKRNQSSINGLNSGNNSYRFKQTREISMDYPIENTKSKFLVNLNTNHLASTDHTSAVNSSPASQQNQFSGQHFYQWQQNYPGCKNNQQNSFHESKNSGVASSNSGIFTTSRIFNKKSFKNISNLSKSQSSSMFFQSAAKNQSRHYQLNSNNLELNRVEPPRSIHDFLHRSQVALNIQQQMLMMDTITQDVLKQNSLQQQQQLKKLQKLQETTIKKSNKNEEEEDGEETKKFNSIIKKENNNSIDSKLAQTQYYHQQLQNQLKNSSTSLQSSLNLPHQNSSQLTNQSIIQNNVERDVSENKLHNQGQFVSLDKIYAQQQQQQQQQTQIQQQQKQQQNQDEPQKSLRVNLNQVKNLNQHSNSTIYSPKENLFLKFNKRNADNTFPELMQKNENIFSLTGGGQMRSQLPHQQSLSLCNQKFIDGLNAVRKAVKREKSCKASLTQQNFEEKSQQQYINGLEGDIPISQQNRDYIHSVHKQNSISKPKISKLRMKPLINQTLTTPIKTCQVISKQLSDRTSAPYVLRSRVKGENKWKESIYFKMNTNYQQFTLKELKSSFDKGNKYNPDGSSTQWNYYLQDTVKQAETKQAQKNQQYSNNTSHHSNLYEEEEAGDYDDNSKLNEDYSRENDDGQSKFNNNLGYLNENNIYFIDQFSKKDNELIANKNKDVFWNVDKDECNQKNENIEEESFYKILKKQNNNNTIEKNHQKDLYSDIVDQQFDKIFQTHFHKSLAIRKVDMVYNIKHLAILKYKREKKLIEGSQDPKDLLDYINKKNQIQILLHNAKKISNLQQVALIIEQKINLQNSRINSIVDQLLIKFDINQSQ